MIGGELDEKIKYIKNRLAFVDNIRRLLKDRVESNITSLFESNLDLQQRVYNRTMELDEANKKLQEEISERKQIEAALRESENRYKRLVDAITDYIYTMEISDGKVVKTTHSAGCLAVTGYTAQEYGENPAIWYGIVHDRDCRRVMEHVGRVLTGESVGPIEYRILHKDGTLRWVRNTIVPRFNSNGELVACDGLITDITERKSAEEALKIYNTELERRVKERAAELLHAKNYLENVLSSMSDILIVVDADDTIKTTNNAVFKLLGYSESELEGKNITEIFGNSIVENIQIARQYGYSKDVFMNVLTQNMEEIQFLVNISRLEVNSYESIIVGHDMREIKKLEEEAKHIQLKLLASSKMATLGEIATGIAHEINQPLTYISSFIQGITMDAKAGNLDANELLKEAKVSFKQIERISVIIKHLLTFGRRNDMETKAINVETIFNNTMLLMRERLRLKNISLIKNIAPNLPGISGNENQLEQVFINIIQNAVDAFISDNTKFPEICVNMGVAKTDNYVYIEFLDNGPGIAEENIEKIFEPFFTTKEVGKGTGLGLSIAYGIIRAHNGIIYCESELKDGAKFTIKIPIEE